MAGEANSVAAPESREESLHWADVLRERWVLVMLGVMVVSLALRLVTWSDVADGEHARYVKVALFGVLASLAVWGLVRVQMGARSVVPIVCALVVLLFGDAVHYVRLLNPITRGGAIQTFSATFADPSAAQRQWDVETSGAGKVSFENGAMRLESPPGATAYAIAQFADVPDVHQQWWLPAGLAERDRTEEFTWRATVNRTGDYYVVTEIRHLLVQAVGYGVRVQYPDSKKATQGFDIQTSATADGKAHEWRLARDARQISLSLDGKTVWSAPQQEEMAQAKLGETKVDAAHGGSMRVESVAYHSALGGPAAPAR